MARLVNVLVRLFEISLGIAVALICSILMAMVMIALRLEGRGPTLVRRQTTDLRGRAFTVWKFRTMSAGSIEQGGDALPDNSYRTTGIGQFLRETELDLIPDVIASLLQGRRQWIGSARGLERAPGTFVERLMRFVFSKKAFETVFAQAVQDMRDEHAEALSRNENEKALWIVFRDHVGISLAAIAYLGVTIGKRVSGIWKLLP